MSEKGVRRLITLASTSPRRRELIGLTGAMFNILAASVDETPLPGEQAEAYVRRLSREKAEAAARRLRRNAETIIVAADTVVVLEGRILGKPADPAEATRLLQALRGKTHTVFSAVTALDNAAGRAVTAVAHTAVPMRRYSDEEIAAYVASGDPLDKAGAYAIQHNGFRPVAVRAIDQSPLLSGCYANVMGLPLCHLARLLKELNVDLPVDVPHACQQFIQYRCPVYEGVLEGKL